jgi:hypothetical protein
MRRNDSQIAPAGKKNGAATPSDGGAHARDRYV